MAAIAGARRYSLSSGSTELVTFDVPLLLASTPPAAEGRGRAVAPLVFDEEQHTSALAAELRRLADVLDPRA